MRGRLGRSIHRAGWLPLALLAAALALVVPVPGHGVARAAAACTVAFDALRTHIELFEGRDVTGACLAPIVYDAEGNGRQQAEGGVFAWRQADNVITFSNDSFIWTLTAAGLERSPQPADPAPPAATGATVCVLPAGPGLPTDTICLDAALANGRFAVRLEANPTTGYRWALAGGVDEALLELLSNSFEAAGQERPVSGAPGHEVWLFEARGTGQTELEFQYARPWETGVPPAFRHHLKVILY